MRIFVVKEHKLVRRPTYTNEDRGLEEGAALYLPPDPIEQPRLYEFSRHDYSNSISTIHPGDIVRLRGLEDLFEAGQKLVQRKVEPVPSPLGYFSNDQEGLFPLSTETIFEDLQELEGTDRALTYAILRADVEHKPAQRAKDIIAKQRICLRILDYFGKKYELTEKVDVWARRCSGGFGPNCKKEPLGFAIFCVVGQILYNQQPYYGKYVHKIEFEGEEELDKIMRNMIKFYVKKE